MKKRQILVSVVVVLAMMMSLVGCGKSEADKFVGEWEAEINLGELLQEELGSELSGMEDILDIGDVEMLLTLEMNEAGTCTASVDEEALEEEIRAMMEDMLTGMMEAMAGEVGMSVDEMLEAQGYTMDQLIDESMQEMDMREITEEFDEVVKFSVEDGKLVLGDETWTYEFESDDSFVVTEIDGADDDSVEKMLPMTFEKK